MEHTSSESASGAGGTYGRGNVAVCAAGRDSVATIRSRSLLPDERRERGRSPDERRERRPERERDDKPPPYTHTHITSLNIYIRHTCIDISLPVARGRVLGRHHRCRLPRRSDDDDATDAKIESVRLRPFRGRVRSRAVCEWSRCVCCDGAQ